MFNFCRKKNKSKNLNTKDIDSLNKKLDRLINEITKLNLDYNAKHDSICNNIKKIQLTLSVLQTDTLNETKILNNPNIENQEHQSNYVLNTFRNNPPDELYVPPRSYENEISLVTLSNTPNYTPLTVYNLSKSDLISEINTDIDTDIDIDINSSCSISYNNIADNNMANVDIKEVAFDCRVKSLPPNLNLAKYINKIDYISHF